MAAVDEKLCDERTGTIMAGQARLEGKIDHLTDLLKGKNGEPGLIDKVRDHDRLIKALGGGLLVVIGAVVTQIIRWAFSHWG